MMRHPVRRTPSGRLGRSQSTLGLLGSQRIPSCGKVTSMWTLPEPSFCNVIFSSMRMQPTQSIVASKGSKMLRMDMAAALAICVSPVFMNVSV